ncbi:MAG: PH domain-containing protein [Acidimicrobiales bacterium]
MAKASKNLEQLRPHLETGETVQAYVEGTYETKIMGTDSVRSGILVATERRMLFFAKKMGGYDLESFPYQNISSLEQGKGMMGGTLKFFASGNTVSMKWINVRNYNLGEFMTLVQSHMNGPTPTEPSPTVAEPDVVDQIPGLLTYAQ